MGQGYHALTEKEKQTLRLIVRGHDAKSTARHLGLSVHTINERLRDARRKLEVSSSREAARLVLDAEGSAPESLTDKQIGEAADNTAMSQLKPPDIGRGSTTRAPWIIAGVVMSAILGILALAALPQPTGPAVPAATAAEASVAQAARDWLALGDQSRWRDGWNGTGTSFRQLNTLETWIAVSEKVRKPLGAVVSRTLVSQERVPAPPAGVEFVKFRTSFANKADALETVSLAREDGRWVVVGVYLD